MACSGNRRVTARRELPRRRGSTFDPRPIDVSDALFGGDIDLRHTRLGYPHLNPTAVVIGEDPRISSIGLCSVVLPRAGCALPSAKAPRCR